MQICPPSSDGKISDGIVVRPQDLWISENFVSKSVESLEGDSDVGGRDPVLKFRAVLKVESLTSYALPNPVEIAKSSDLRLGQTLLAISNFRSFGGHTLTKGILSAKGKIWQDMGHGKKPTQEPVYIVGQGKQEFKFFFIGIAD